ncbi:Gryzun, putative trafficking through golgi-domain-containing protein [Gigaspora margarita]|uniref:Gryzun, putative trafficking through golgi-domain-containing protein n=2 Tax=Gigaspora margarita TaxID=4874 RepID=A0A8H4ENN6_GIGMA|nr:Gryzun, putative trafficking through golgi-domain-containing protein [Gigaspora margarita]
MDSYPPEFILHHVPLMVVFGLGTVKDLAEQTTVPSPSSSKSAHSRQSSISTNSTFTRQQISKNLLTQLTAKSQAGVWEFGKSAGNAFHVEAVDKNFQLPPRKPMMRPQQPSHHSAMNITHSSLSPLTPGSPVYPDGLIPPIWVRRHHVLLPSVVVGFYDLWHRSMSGSIKEKDESTITPSEMLGSAEPIEKEKDGNLAMEINEKRKYLHERGIRFAAVIILNAQHSEDPITEERLGYIRKMSGLDARNCFFVLLPDRDISEFVTTLQKGLYEHSLKYYREHGNRVKRKRNKLPSPATAGYVRPSSDYHSSAPAPLSIQGWMFRYDYKMATFAEFRQDIDASIHYYESAYTLLVDFFAPQSAITPGAPGLQIRSKRWNDARILADCINIKICKMNLYIDAPSAALAQLNKHITTFKRLCNTLEIGDDTFEYWTWLSNQYRVFADILDIATRSGFIIPDPTTVFHTTSSADYRFGSSSNSPMAGSGINPTMVLQHPGFYFHLAAQCNSVRRKKLLAVEKIIQASGDALKFPSGLEAERKVDHSALTIELLTKSYEQFKKYKGGRMTLYLASEIAGAHYEAENYVMALKFYERIAKKYRKEGWHTILESILNCSLKCAKESGTWDNVVEYLIELLSDRFHMSEQKRIEIQNKLMNVIFKTEISSLVNFRQVVIDMNEINSFSTCYVQFKEPATFIATPTPFQITFITPSDTPPLPLQFTYLQLSFNDSNFNHYFTHKPNDESDDTKLQCVNCKECLRKDVDGEGYIWFKSVDLTFRKGSTKVFEGLIIPKESGDLQLQIITLGFLSENWKIDLRFDVSTPREEPLKRKWLQFETMSNGEQVEQPFFINLEGTGDRASIKVTQKQAKLDIKVNHSAPALLDEHYPIQLTILNLEPEDIKAVLKAELISDLQESEDVIFDSNLNTTNHLKEVDLGVISSNESYVKTIYIIGKKTTNLRTLRLTVLYSTSSLIPSTPTPIQNWIEKREDIRIPFIAPFSVSFNISPQGEEFGNAREISSLDRIERHFLVAKITSIGPWDICVSGIELSLLDQANAQTKIEIISSSIELDSESLEQVWRQGYIFNVNYLLELTILNDASLSESVDIGLLDIKWRRNQPFGNISVPFIETTMMVPQLQRHDSELSVILDIPPNPIVGQIFTLTFKIINWTSAPVRIRVTVEVNDAFVFSGYKQTYFIVSPLSTYYFKANCFPLAPGKVKLPRVKMMKAGDNGAAEQEVPITAPGFKEPVEDEWYMVFIKPKKEINE